MRKIDNRVWTTWSGGVDSTALVAHLLKNGFEVWPIVFEFGPPAYQESEALARHRIRAHFEREYGDLFHEELKIDGSFLSENFSLDRGREVLRRNKHIMDYIMMNYVLPADGTFIGMGTYVGADTSAVDHLHGKDTDSRYLTAYLLSEYGIEYQLLSLADFANGKSRYKTDQIRILLDAAPWSVLLSTYNCMTGYPEAIGVHCGVCYKCVERSAAMEFLFGKDGDATKYYTDPHTMWYHAAYMKHFKGEHISLSWSEVRIGNQGSHKADGH